ncbi:MAG: CocE/NonD family hydrolase [Bacteroidota bacterium]|nr:CocE/NonD family hydrolase [Bacteroidota bacterium]
MKLLIRFLFLLAPLSALAQNVDSIWMRQNYNKVEQYISMRDGVKLFTSIYVPKDSLEKHPILLTRTPYSCAPYGKNEFRPFWQTFYKEYLKEKYIMVIQDVRGRWMSEGTFVDVRPFNPNKKGDKYIDEASDTYDAIDWMVKNIRSNNGKVGVFGISYPGFYSTMAALSNHPALKAVSPQAPVTDWFVGDDFHHNGAFMMMDAFAFYSSFGRPRVRPTTIAPLPFDYFTKDNYEFYLRNGALSNLTKNYMGDSIVFWNDLMNHPNYDAWWQARNARNFLEDVKPAILVVGGLFDAEDCFGAWNTYKAIEAKSPATNNRLVMGPWFHGGWVRSDGSKLGNVQFGSKTSEWYQKNIELPFFNYYLKGKGTAQNIAEATVFFTGENKWHQLKQWPPAEVEFKELFLDKNKKLTWTIPAGVGTSEKPKDEDTFTEYISDPSTPVPYTEDVHFARTREYMTDDQRFASRRPDVLTFTTGILSDDIAVTGPVTADLMISTTSTDADFVVKVIDVFPDQFKYSDTDKYQMNGYQMLVRGDVMRGKFRNSLEKPEPFVPKKITNVKFTLPDVAHTFKSGHKIMIQIQSSWFPLVDRNPQKFMDIYHAKDEDFQKASIKVYHNGSMNSKIILPVLTR